VRAGAGARALAAAALIAVACAPGGGTRPEPGPTVRIVPAGDGPVAPLVTAAAARAKAEGRRLLVYVGATWCEPCVVFHDAVAAGALDRELAAVTFLEFDADRDEARLAEAGYASQWLPLFSVPADDGSATSRRIEGARRSGDYARDLAGRLRPLLDR
jgi:hypothetical protein